MVRRSWLFCSVLFIALFACAPSPGAMQGVPQPADRRAHGDGGRREAAVPDRGHRAGDRAAARLRGNVAHVAAADSAGSRRASPSIAPDLPGIGGSDIPADGLDMARSAVRIHALVKSLGIEKAVVVGHDIGLMVAYAYAAQFPSETEKLVLMDAFLPGVAGWEAIYNNPGDLAFSLQRADAGSAGQGTRAHLLRALLERLRRGQDAVDSRSRSSGLHRRLCASGTDAGGVGVLRLVSAGREGLRAALADEADDAGAVDWRREGERRRARPSR